MNRYTLFIKDTLQYARIRNLLNEKKITHTDYRTSERYYIVLYCEDIYKVSPIFYKYE